MKGAAQSRPSKASLVARGLAAKPLKGKRIISKGKKVPDAKPGFCLYSTDSEVQASSVGRGLDRCATLLTNILDNDNKGPKKRKENKPTIKERGKSTSTKPPSTKLKAKSNNAKPIVIPTASHKDQGPSAPYNERLVASTPILNPDERKKQQHLLEKEQELTRQLHQLRQHYELLQRQKSPEIQEQQKRTLQDSMIHELDDYQQTEHDSNHQRQSASPSEGTPSARKSLDYNRKPPDKSRIDSEKDLRPKEQFNTSSEFHRSQQILDHEEDTQHDSSLSSKLRSSSRQDNTVGPKKQVRVVSPDLSERYHPKSVSPQDDMSPSRSLHPSLVSNTTGESLSPSAANNEIRTLQYLMRELREVIGSSDDLEVNRLLMEIDHTCSILPYLMPLSSPNKNDDEDLHTKRLRLENAHIKRKLQSATEKSQEQERTMQNIRNIQSGQTNVSFELAACKSENASLQKRLKEEREENERLHKHLGNLEQVVENLREDKKKFIQILENKEHTFSKNRRSSQLETLKLSNEIKQLKAEVEAGKLSLEAAKKESVILNLSLKQKDAEIERLNQLTKALNQSMRRVLGDIQEYKPNSSNGGIMEDKGVFNMDHLSHVSLLAAPSSEDTLQSNEVVNDIKRSEPLQGYRPRHSGIDYLSIFNEQPNEGLFSTNKRTIGTLYKNSPLLMHSSLKQRNSLSPHIRTSIQSPQPLPTEEPVYEFSPKASFGEGAWTECKDKSLELSSFSSRDEEDFQRDLANLDADIARIQKSLRETAKRS